MPSKSESPSEVLRWLQSQTADLWPAVLGSLSLRRSPCVRENCRACQSGEQHPSYVLYGRLKGRRFAVYVPEELVPEVRRCLDNGRALQELLFQAAPRYVKALKRERDQASKKKENEKWPILGIPKLVWADGNCFRKGLTLGRRLRPFSDFSAYNKRRLERK